MLYTLRAVHRKNRLTILYAYPFTFFFSTVLGGVVNIVFPMFIYLFMFEQQVSATFIQYANTSDYTSFITLGASINVLAIATILNVSRALITEIREGTLEPFLLSPASRIGYYLGCLVEQTSRAFLEFAIVLFIGFLFGFRFPLVLLPQFIFIVLLAIFSFFAMSIPLSALMVQTRDTYISQNTIFISMLFLSGALFPVEFLPYPLQLVANIFPNTPILIVFRGVILSGQTIAENLIPLIHCLGLSLLFIALGAAYVRASEKKLIENVYA